MQNEYVFRDSAKSDYMKEYLDGYIHISIENIAMYIETDISDVLKGTRTKYKCYIVYNINNHITINAFKENDIEILQSTKIIDPSKISALECSKDILLSVGLPQKHQCILRSVGIRTKDVLKQDFSPYKEITDLDHNSIYARLYAEIYNNLYELFAKQ